MLETVLLTSVLLADSVAPDKVQNLDEVLIVSYDGRAPQRSVKGQAASIDEHLSGLRNVNLVRRGSYAWEPVVNNMQTERLSTTIDGMKIFYACTDKMDPVTSYVESGNLQSISLNSGLDGNPQATGNIGGSLDLKLRKIGFEADPRHVNVLAGHEWNGHLQVYGADAAFSGYRTYLNAGLFYRSADCYRVGGGELLNYSQFGKVNMFANAGLRLTEADVLEATLIFDRATDVGYPALNMDVSRAQGFISSVSYKHQFARVGWETKAYYNHIIHIMDDTTRPEVEIHMDMPGDSWTAGLYSLATTSLDLAGNQHDVAVNYDLYYNRLFADMTMYPGGAAPMYMVTWPDVGTFNTGLSLTDNVSIASNQSLRLSAKIAWQNQRLNNEEGYHGQKVFFPRMTDTYYQTTGRVAAAYQVTLGHSEISLGTGWGSRAPTVTEAYGYYLNNTFDQYDYMGNPHLANESAVEVNGAYKFSAQDLGIGLDANAFFFKDYIIGHLDSRLSAMTVGAEGVKVYGNLEHAVIANASVTADWQISRRLAWNGKLSYSVGRDDVADALPLISPLSWRTSIEYGFGALQAQVELRGNARQTNYAAKYGEILTAGWNIVNLSASYRFKAATLRGGVENLFDRKYSTYSDWNNIPQKGRNIYLNLTIEL